MRKLQLMAIICLLPLMIAFAQISEQQNNYIFASIDNQHEVIDKMYHDYTTEYTTPLLQIPTESVNTNVQMTSKEQFHNGSSELHSDEYPIKDKSTRSKKMTKKVTKKSKIYHFRDNGWIEMRNNKGVSYGIKYQPKMKLTESKKVRKWLKKAQKGKKQLSKTDFQLVPDKENLTLTAYLNGADKSTYHIKLVNEEGQMIKSFAHLAPITVQEIQLNQLLPGKYQLSLYSGIERRLISTYNLKY